MLEEALHVAAQSLVSKQRGPPQQLTLATQELSYKSVAMIEAMSRWLATVDNSLPTATPALCQAIKFSIINMLTVSFTHICMLTRQCVQRVATHLPVHLRVTQVSPAPDVDPLMATLRRVGLIKMWLTNTSLFLLTVDDATPKEQLTEIFKALRAAHSIMKSWLREQTKQQQK